MGRDDIVLNFKEVDEMNSLIQGVLVDFLMEKLLTYQGRLVISLRVVD